MFLNIYGSVKIFMTIFAILSQKANFNYLKVIIANKINKVQLTFSITEILKGYNLKKKLTQK